MEKEKVLRINHLAEKKKKEGLTPDEAKEQKLLYEEYLAAIRKNFRATLDNIEIVDKQ